MDVPNAIFYNQFFDEELRVQEGKFDYKKKIGTEVIKKVCLITSNFTKLKKLQIEDPQVYSGLEIFGEYHTPILEKHSSSLSNDNRRRAASLSTCAKYMAALCIENNEEEGYFQGSALWALYALTPPILQAAPKWKNFIRKEFIIDFMDYKVMSENERIKNIQAVQERLYSGDTWQTTLTKDYHSFFKESFSPNVEPNISSIIKESKMFRRQFVSV